MGSKKKTSAADISKIIGKVSAKKKPTPEEIDAREERREKSRQYRIKKSEGNLRKSKIYRSYDSLSAPEDVRDYLKFLYRKRHKAARKKGKRVKFNIPVLKDAEQYTAISSNKKDPKFQIYWNLPIFVTGLAPINHRIINFNSRIVYKGPSLALSIKAINDINRDIDNAREEIAELGGHNSKDSDKILFVPTITYKRRTFRKKNKPFLVEVDYSKSEGDQKLMKKFKLIKPKKK